MSYRLIVSKRAKRDLKKMDWDNKARIRQAIDGLASDPCPPSS